MQGRPTEFIMLLMTQLPPISTLFPYTTLFRSLGQRRLAHALGTLRALRQHEVAHLRSEEHTSELQSHSDIVCRLLLEKTKFHHRTFPGVSGRRSGRLSW